MVYKQIGPVACTIIAFKKKKYNDLQTAEDKHF
jgi:hypothetical protein